MSLWVDKHRPGSIDELNLHSEITAQLKQLAASGDLPHLLMYGPSGAGKMTRIRAMLRVIYDISASKIKFDERAFQTPSGRRVEITVFSSIYHIEVNPSDVGIYDRVIVQEIIKELAQTQQVDKTRRPFKVAVILEADRLSKDAQHALRRTMEKHTSNLRLILCCSTTGRIIAPIKSRCLLMRVPCPTPIEIGHVLASVSAKEGFKASPALIAKVAEDSAGNLRRALLQIEASSMKHGDELDRLDWELFIDQICDQVLREQSPSNLLAIRPKLYELLTHCIPPSLVIKKIAFGIVERADPSLAHETIQCAAEYERRLSKGSKAIFHLEAFVAKMMSIYARFTSKALDH